MNPETEKAKSTAEALDQIIYKLVSEEAKKIYGASEGQFFWDQFSAIHLMLLKAELIRFELMAERNLRNKIIKKFTRTVFPHLAKFPESDSMNFDRDEWLCIKNIWEDQ